MSNQISSTITTKTTLEEMAQIEGIREMIPYFVYSPQGLGGGITMDMSLEDIEKKQPTWNAQDMLVGIRRLMELQKTNRNMTTEDHVSLIHSVYGEMETQEDPLKKDVKLFLFPAESKHYVILAAGGAYGSVCSLPESFPVAARLNELGITVLVLNYRVGGRQLFPKPMEDLAAAYGYIEAHGAELGVNPTQYAVGGFSAGAHLAACWGTKKTGYEHYHCPKPQMLMLAYPMVDVWSTIQLLPEVYQKMMLTGYFGADYSREMCQPYEVAQNVESDYPPSYVIQASDDGTVPVSNSEHLAQQLNEQQVKYQYEQVESGNHGFGLGSATAAAGWVMRAVQFWNSIRP